VRSARRGRCSCSTRAATSGSCARTSSSTRRSVSCSTWARRTCRSGRGEGTMTEGRVRRGRLCRHERPRGSGGGGERGGGGEGERWVGGDKGPAKKRVNYHTRCFVALSPFRRHRKSRKRFFCISMVWDPPYRA